MTYLNLNVWTAVINNVLNRIDEYIYLKAMEVSSGDGMYIGPVIKNRKDSISELKIKSYQLMLENGKLKEKRILLGSFLEYPRFCGPREAVFNALCFQNRGCSHFIVSQDYAPTDLYEERAIRELFDNLTDIKITPIFFGKIGYNPNVNKFCDLEMPGTLRHFNYNQIQELLYSKQNIPSWFIHEAVEEMLRDHICLKDQ